MSRKASLVRKIRLAYLLSLATAAAILPLSAATAEEKSASSRSAAKLLERPLWGEIYAESEFTEHEGHNIVSDLFVKQGTSWAALGGGPLDFYLKARIYHDREGFFWNNRGEAGVGVRWRPPAVEGLVLFCELLYGDYTGRENSKEPNPDEGAYYDVQSGAAFWRWWGPALWQIEGAKVYLPFTGWRELYADAIYYDHASQNFIATLEYKEGLGQASMGPVGLDAYVAVEASADTRGDEWYNYVHVGPGIRLTPFPDVDFKISFEYLWSRYYRGGYEEVAASSSSLVITAAFWHGW